MKAKHKDRVFFPNLDGLRFFAFFLVYLQHGFGNAVSSGTAQGLLLSSLRQSIFEAGWAGVSFFFVLSGFLITYLLLSEVELNGKVDVIAFYLRRMLRIWPLYYAVLLFGFVLYPAIKSLLGMSSYIEAGNPLYYVFFVGNFDVINLGGGHGAMSTNITWSVAIEEQFYLVWPLLFSRIPQRFYKYIFPSIIVLSAAFRLAYADNGMVLYFHSLSVISDMAVGGGAAYLAIKSSSFKDLFAKMPRAAIMSVYLCGGLLLLFRDQIFITPFLNMLQRLLFSLLFAFIVCEQNYCRKSFVKMENFKFISKLGIYTYGLYLLHPIVITLIEGASKISIGRTVTGSLGIGVGIVGLILSILLSGASYHWFERRFLDLKRRFTHIASTQATQSPLSEGDRLRAGASAR